MEQELNEEVIEAHSEKQESAFFSEKKITACITGIQWGKTTAGAVWLRNRIFDNLQSGVSFLVTAPTYKILEQSTLPAFMKIMEGYGRFNQQKASFQVNGGGIVYFRTSKEPDSIVGMTNVQGIWCDEAGKYPLYFWENIQGRASFKDCPIMITTSPYSMNWIYKEIFKPAKTGRREDILLIQASSIDNPFFPKEVFKRKKETMDPRRFNMMYCGDFDKMQGLVYDCFDDHENQCEPIKLPNGTKYYAGVDWGYTDPFVLKVRAITPEGQHFGVSEFYKSGLTITDIIPIAKQKKQTFGIQTFWCGPDQPGYIEEFNRNGLSALPANNDIRRGVDLHYELIKTRRLKYFKGLNPNTLDEMETYHYPEPEDLGPDDKSKEQNPVGQNDHAMDADRYCTMMTYRSGLKLVPKTPIDGTNKPQTEAERIKLRMKKKGQDQSETW